MIFYLQAETPSIIKDGEYQQIIPDYHLFGIKYLGKIARNKNTTDSYDEKQDQRIIIKLDGDKENINKLLSTYSFLKEITKSDMQSLKKELQFNEEI